MKQFRDALFKDVGIDLGTANSLIYVRGIGLSLSEPTVAAINTKTSQILAVGDEAKRMLGRTPSHINVVRPLTGGVVSDYDMAQELLRGLLKRVESAPLFGYRTGIVAIPDNLTEVERKSVEDAVIAAGCSRVFLIESPVAAALGAGLPILSPTASLVVDIGGGTTDVAVISMGGTVVSRTLRIAGDKFNEDIIRFVRDEFKTAIGEATAEDAKIAVASAVPIEEKLEFPVRGRDLSTGLPQEVILRNVHLRQATAKSVKSIIETVLEVIEATPPELAGDMLKQGICLCGGGALLRGIDKLIEKEAGVSTFIANDPLTCVVRGLGRIVEDMEGHGVLLDNPYKPMSINL